MTCETLMIRSDASTQIGIGHVMRCLAVGEAWRDRGGRVVFALASGSDEMEKRLQRVGMEIARISAMPGTTEDSLETVELCSKYRGTWLILDGFHFSWEYRQHLTKAAAHLLFFDDHGEFAPYCCDIILNTNPYADDSMYPERENGTRFLLGPPYGLLRKEFLAQPCASRETPKQARKILVTFGGSDSDNVTLRVVEALQTLEDMVLETVVVVGAANPHRGVLERAIQGCRGVELLLNADNMSEVMSGTDLAISAGGGTCYELAFLRVPMFLITIAQNHERTVAAWGERGAAINAGWFHQLDRNRLAAWVQDVISDQPLRRKLAETAGQMVDGRGAERVVDAMKESAITVGD